MTYYRICNFLQFQNFKSNQNTEIDQNTQSIVENDNLTTLNEINRNNTMRKKSVAFSMINKKQFRKSSNQATIETDLTTNFNTNNQKCMILLGLRINAMVF